MRLSLLTGIVANGALFVLYLQVDQIIAASFRPYILLPVVTRAASTSEVFVWLHRLEDEGELPDT